MKNEKMISQFCKPCIFVVNKFEMAKYTVHASPRQTISQKLIKLHTIFCVGQIEFFIFVLHLREGNWKCRIPIVCLKIVKYEEKVIK